MSKLVSMMHAPKPAPPAQAVQPVRPVQAAPAARSGVRRTIQHAFMDTAISGAAAVLVFAGQPAQAGETLYAGNKSYEAELEALIASRNATRPELTDAPSVAEPTIKREPAKKEEAPSAPFNFLPDVPLKLSDVPKTLLETPSLVPTPDLAPAAPFEQPSAPMVPYPGPPAPPSFLSTPEPPKAPPKAGLPPIAPPPPSAPQAGSPAAAPSLPVPSVPAEAPSGPSLAIGLGGVAVLAAAGLAVANNNNSSGGGMDLSASANGATPMASSSSASSSSPEDPAVAAKQNAKEAAEWIKKWRQSQS